MPPSYVMAAIIIGAGLVGGYLLMRAIDYITEPPKPQPPTNAEELDKLVRDFVALYGDKPPTVLDEPVVTSHRRDGRPVHTFPRAIPWGGFGRVLDSGWWELRDDASAYDWQHGRNEKGPWE